MTATEEPTFTPLDTELFTVRATQLLKEYTPKLRRIAEGAIELRAKGTSRPFDAAEIDFQRLRGLLKYLEAPSEDLARQVSAVIEESKIDRLNRVTLWLALAEFEFEYTQAKEAIEELSKTKAKQPTGRSRGK